MPPSEPAPATSRRRAAARVLAAGVATLCLAGTVCAQYQPRRATIRPIDFATSQNDNLFTLIRSQDDIHTLRLAIEQLAAGEHEAAVQRLHELLRIAARGVVPVAPGRYVGLRAAVTAVLANLSPRARAAYEQLARREAAPLFDRERTAMSTNQLHQLVARFPTTKAGFAARMLLGDRALEAGDGIVAARHYRAAIDASGFGSDEERRAVDRLHQAEVLVEPRTARARSASDVLPPVASALLPILPPARGEWRGIGDCRSGTAPMREPIGTPEPYWRADVVAPGFDYKEKGELALHATGNVDTLFVNTGRRVLALDPLRRALRWQSNAPLDDLGDADWERPSRRDRIRNRRWNDPPQPGETINQDMVLAPALGDDVVVAALQVPDDTITVEFQRSYRVMNKIPRRRLFGYSRRTGKVLWQHFDELDGRVTRRFAGHDSCGPPLIAGDTVYAPMHDRSGAIKFSIAAYDLHTGEPRWRHLVCSSQQDVNMFGNARQEFAASPLTLADGVLYGATNLGVAFAVDAADGRIRWIRAYEVVRMPPTMLRDQDDRPVYFANNAPVVCDGVACMTPLDSPHVLGLDVDSGELLWRLPHAAAVNGTENRVQWLCGAIDGEFVCSGAGVIAVATRPAAGDAGGVAVARQLVRPAQLRSNRYGVTPGRAAVTADHVYVPTTAGVLGFDRTGSPHPSLDLIPVDGFRPGNLLLVDGVIVALRNRSLDVLLDPNALLASSEARVREHGDDPDALLRLATLRRALLVRSEDAGSIADNQTVLELFRRGLEACIDRGLPTDHPTRMALQGALYDQAKVVADVAVERDSPDALELLARARQLAPDQGAWVAMQLRVLQRCRQDRDRYLDELDRLEQHAGDARLPAPLELPVAAFVLWQRALAQHDQPAAAVALWQQLIERHGSVPLDSEALGDLARRGIDTLVEQHGRDVYAAIAARADQALEEAGDDVVALSAVARRFPNSEAARRADLKLLDRAVDDGDLGAATTVLAKDVRKDGAATAGVLRRVQVAAIRRGNLALARAVARRLQEFRGTASDWGDDDGADVADIAHRAAETLPTAHRPPLQVPTTELARIRPRDQYEHVRALRTEVGAGFDQPADAPLYVHAGDDLVAFRPGRARSEELWRHPVEFLEGLIQCGSTLLVPDMQRLFAVHYQSGELLWEASFDDQRLIEVLDLTEGVLHCLTRPAIPDGHHMLLGIEPLTGTVLFRRALEAAELKPKPSHGELLLMTIGDATTVTRLDPITGTTRAVVSCQQALGEDGLMLRPQSLTTTLFPQRLSADDERIYLPRYGTQSPTPKVFAIANDGELAWTWTGRSGGTLQLAQRRGDRYVVAEDHPSEGCRVVLLDCRTGEVLRATPIGYDANPLNWEHSWADNEVPPTLAFAAEVEPRSNQLQVVLFAVDPGPSFAVPLGGDDQLVVRSACFGPGFVTFGARARNGTGAFRLYAVDLQSRVGRFDEQRPYRPVPSNTTPHGMLRLGPYTVLSTTGDLIVLGAPEPDNR